MRTVRISFAGGLGSIPSLDEILNVETYLMETSTVMKYPEADLLI